MKRETISFRIEPMKQRVHRALFDDELPFKPRIEKSKKKDHPRRAKHRNKPDNWE